MHANVGAGLVPAQPGNAMQNRSMREKSVKENASKLKMGKRATTRDCPYNVQ